VPAFGVILKHYVPQYSHQQKGWGFHLLSGVYVIEKCQAIPLAAFGPRAILAGWKQAVAQRVNQLILTKFLNEDS
jgi:hypothetical protein